MSTEELTGNRGEWSEIYVMFKLLADGELYAADADLEKIPYIFYPIIKIIRDEISGKWEYYREKSIKIINATTEEVIGTIPAEKFKENAEIVLNGIKEAESRTFSIPRAEIFMKTIKCETLKANSQDKRDITIKVHDLKTGFNPILGFSIKSQLGSPSTLFNASQSTNFVYRIRGLERDDIDEINSITSRGKLKARVNEITERGGVFEFAKIDNTNFDLNLKLIDSRLPEILSEVLLSYFEGNGPSIEDLIAHVAEANPCGFNFEYSHPFYKYKIKNLLTDIALGMTPTGRWDGFYDATGGFVIVREDGEVLCYHIYNRNEFQEWLVKNTKLETPSSSRHKFGKLYEKDGSIYFKLNLQIRFIN